MKSKLVLISFVLILLFCTLTGTSLVLGFAVAIVIGILLLKSDGMDMKKLSRHMIGNMVMCKDIYLLVLLMGMTISIWIASGIVPSMVYYGFNLINNMNFLLVSFLATSLVSLTMGTAIGVFSTIGMAFYAIGKGLMIPDAILLGAIISGSFVADKISPLSSLTNLTINLLKTNYKDYLKSALKTMIPIMILSGIIFYIIGMKYSSNIPIDQLTSYQEGIAAGFKVNPLLALFPLAVVIMAVLGVKIILNLTISVAVGGAVCLLYQGNSLLEVLKYLLLGFSENIPIGDLGNILKGGGAIGMVEVIIIIAGSIAFSGILEGANVIQPLLERIARKAKSAASLVVRTGIFSILMTIVTCDQTVGILLPARFLKEDFEQKGMSKEILARTIADTGTIVAPLFPWNVNTIIIVGITGVSAVKFAPYVVLCYLSPLVTFAVAYLAGKGKKTIKA